MIATNPTSKLLWMSTLIIALLLPSLSSAFTYRVKTCSSYKASNTNNALSKYCTCTVKLCPNQYASIDSCNKCTGNQYLRLYAPNNTQVAQSNGLSSTCSAPSTCSRISNFRPMSATKCQTFTLREGCAGTGKCSAIVKIFVANTTIPSNYTSAATLSVSHGIGFPSLASPLVSLASFFNGEQYEEEIHRDEEDHEEDWQVEEAPDTGLEEKDPFGAMESAIRFHNTHKATTPIMEDGLLSEQVRDVASENSNEEFAVDSQHRRLVGVPTRSPSRSPSRSPTRKPTSFSVSVSGYCMTKVKATKVGMVVGIIIPIVGILAIVGISIYRRQQRNKVGADGIQMMPQPGYGGQPQPMMGQPQQPMMVGQPQYAMGQPQVQPIGMGQPQQQPMMMGQPQYAMGQPQQQPMMMGQPQYAMGQPQQQPMMMGQPQYTMGQPQQQPMMMGQPQPMMGQPQYMMNPPQAQPVMMTPGGYAPVPQGY